MSPLRHPIARNCEPRVLEALADTSIVALQGARQVGKSTLARALTAALGGEFVSLDDGISRRAAEADPAAFVARHRLLCIDEIQRVPELILAIKSEVDRDRRPGRFLVTGSSDLARLRSIRDSLAGRIERCVLHGFSQDELGDLAVSFVDGVFQGRLAETASASASRSDYIERACIGGYPEAVFREGRRRSAWFESYITDLLDRDAPELAGRQRVHALPDLMRLIAARNASEVNAASFARAAGFPERTLSSYLDLLDQLFLTFRLPAWSNVRGRRVIGRPKIYISDSGLAAHLAHLSPAALDPHRDPRPAGALIESLVVGELRRQSGWAEEPVRLYHFRDRNGPQIDVILAHDDGRVAGLEVKASTSIGDDAFDGLRFLRDRLGERFIGGILLYAGPQTLSFGDRLSARPISTIWSTPSE